MKRAKVALIKEFPNRGDISIVGTYHWDKLWKMIMSSTQERVKSNEKFCGKEVVFSKTKCISCSSIRYLTNNILFESHITLIF